MYQIQVNYIAVLVVGVFSFVLGAVWYSPPLFAKQWMSAIGKSEDQLRKGASGMTYVITFIVWMVSSYLLAVFVHYSGASTFGYGMLAGFLCWFGFFASLSLMMNLFAQDRIKLWLINSGYVLAALLVGGGILAVWR